VVHIEPGKGLLRWCLPFMLPLWRCHAAGMRRAMGLGLASELAIAHTAGAARAAPGTTAGGS
jgi:hypothetical protein